MEILVISHLLILRHKWKTNKEAAKKLLAEFNENIVGMVLYNILTYLLITMTRIHIMSLIMMQRIYLKRS